MKTSEFKKWLDDNYWQYSETENVIEVNDVLEVEKKIFKNIQFNNWYGRAETIDLLKVVIEYAETPILEREDEKKYVIRVRLYMDGYGMTCDNFTIFQDKDDFQYYFTEKEIKAIDERLMAFAEEVKE